MRAYVEFSVPVLVEVDLDEQEIVGVYVDDEQVDGPSGVIALEPGGLSDAEASRAIQATENETWPAWAFGL